MYFINILSPRLKKIHADDRYLMRWLSTYLIQNFANNHIWLIISVIILTGKKIFYYNIDGKYAVCSEN